MRRALALSVATLLVAAGCGGTAVAPSPSPTVGGSAAATATPKPSPFKLVVSYSNIIGDELPLWAGASSKVLLRDAPDSLLARIARSSPYGEDHVRRLREWIDEAARRGYAVSHGEREDGLSAVAVPVTGRSGAVVAALTLSGATLRFPDERNEPFVADLQQVARRMSDRGFDRPLPSI